MLYLRRLRHAPIPTGLICIALLGAADGAAALYQPSAAAHAESATQLPVAWDVAFADKSGNTPLHFTARYIDARGVHRLEEWRQGQEHLRRQTDHRIDLHADRTSRILPGQPPDYTWQILDLDRRIAHRVSTAGMLHLGMLYSYYSMAHVLVRPAGKFAVTATHAPGPVDTLTAGLPPAAFRAACTWWQVDAAGLAPTSLCWSSRFGIPLQMWTSSPAGWRRTFQVDSLTTAPIARKQFAADLTGLQVRDVDEIEDSD